MTVILVLGTMEQHFQGDTEEKVTKNDLSPEGDVTGAIWSSGCQQTNIKIFICQEIGLLINIHYFCKFTQSLTGTLKRMWKLCRLGRQAGPQQTKLELTAEWVPSLPFSSFC